MIMLVLTVGTLFSCASIEAFADNIQVNSTNFPDANFRSVLSGKEYDKDQNGYLSAGEINSVSLLDIHEKDIA